MKSQPLNKRYIALRATWIFLSVFCFLFLCPKIYSLSSLHSPDEILAERYALARNFEKQGRGRTSILLYQALESSLAFQGPAAQREIILFFQNKNFSKGFKKTRALLSRSPIDSPWPLQALALSLSKKNVPFDLVQKAWKLFQKLPSKNPHYHLLLHSLAKHYLLSSDTTTAFFLLSYAYQSHPAKKSAEQLVKFFPYSHIPALSLARTLFDQGDLIVSKPLWEKVLRSPSQPYDKDYAKINISKIEYQKGQIEPAISLAKTIQPESAEYISSLAAQSEWARKNGDPALSSLLLKKLLSIPRAQQDTPLLLSIALRKARKEQTQNAWEKVVRKLGKKDIKIAIEAFWRLAREKLKNEDEAPFHQFEKWIQSMPISSPGKSNFKSGEIGRSLLLNLYALRARRRMEQKKWREARKAWGEIATLNPDSIEAEEARQNLKKIFLFLPLSQESIHIERLLSLPSDSFCKAAIAFNASFPTEEFKNKIIKKILQDSSLRQPHHLSKLSLKQKKALHLSNLFLQWGFKDEARITLQWYFPSILPRTNIIKTFAQAFPKTGAEMAAFALRFQPCREFFPPSSLSWMAYPLKESNEIKTLLKGNKKTQIAIALVAIDRWNKLEAGDDKISLRKAFSALKRIKKNKLKTSDFIRLAFQLNHTPKRYQNISESLSAIKSPYKMKKIKSLIENFLAYEKFYETLQP